MSNESMIATLKATPTTSPEYNKIRTEILAANQGLIGMMIKRRGVRNPTHVEDIMATGQISLLKAIDGFDPATGMAFTTYATSAINNDITKYQRRLTRDHKRTPFQYDPARQQKVTDPDTVKTRENAAELKSMLDENVAGLTNIQREVINRRFGFTGRIETLEEIGISLNLSKERVRQISNQAQEKLKTAMEGILV